MIPEPYRTIAEVAVAFVLLAMALRWTRRPAYCQWGCAPGRCNHRGERRADGWELGV